MTVSMKTAAVPELRKTICSSAIFQEAMAQEHHYDTTLGRHSVLVYRQALRICKALEKKGIMTDRRCITVASLCHDLGMVGRKDRYKNNLECCIKHPRAALAEAGKLIDNIDPKTKKAILSHMWPLGVRIPTSREGWILAAADKIVSTAGTVHIILHMLPAKRKHAGRHISPLR